MFNVGTGEMLIILVVALLVLGPTRLPELARGIGKFVRQFRRQTEDVRSMVEREFYKMDDDIRQLDGHNANAPVAAQPYPDHPPTPELPTSESSQVSESSDTTDPEAPVVEPSHSDASLSQEGSASEAPIHGEMEGAEPTLVMNIPDTAQHEGSKKADPVSIRSDHEDKLGRNR